MFNDHFDKMIKHVITFCFKKISQTKSDIC